MTTPLIDLSPPPPPAPLPAAAPPSAAARRPTRDATTRGPVQLPRFLPLTSPVIPGLDSAADWDAFLQAVFDRLTPDGAVEQTCAHRIAALLWRLDRIVRVETDEIVHALDTAERDAAGLLPPDDQPAPAGATNAHPAGAPGAPSTIDATRAFAALPRDPTALRRRLADARLAATALYDLTQVPGHETVPDEHATVALRFIADYCGTPGSPDAVLPGPGPTGQWTGARLRSAMGTLCVNRSLGDVIPATTAYAHATIAAAERRLALLEPLAARLRRQRLIPPPPIAGQLQSYESHLATQLDLALAQLAGLQAHRVERDGSG